MPKPGDDVAGSAWFRLLAASGKACHPHLALWRFVSDADVLPDDDGEISDDDMQAAERGLAELRRAALVVAAMDVVDRCIDDLQLTVFGDDGQPDAGEAEDSFVYEWFPPRHRRAYDEGFFRKVMVTAVQVAADLASPHGGLASCTAEEIIRHAIGALAGELCEEAGLGKPWLHPDETLLEDIDFQWLYWKDTDGLEDDPGMQAALGIDAPPLADWFSPFSDSRVVHPYAETSPSAPLVHDLYPRLAPGGDPMVLMDPGVVDAAAPVTSLAAGSEAVALARRVAIRGDGRWVADDRDPERSFGELVTASAGDGGSGWLDWEPYDGADSIRSEPVIRLTAHRHFPAGDDEPWVDAAIGHGRFLAIPLRFVVSYRADPQVRERREQMYSDPPA